MQQFRAKNMYRFTEAWTIESNENRKTLEWDKIDKKKKHSQDDETPMAKTNENHQTLKWNSFEMEKLDTCRIFNAFRF